MRLSHRFPRMPILFLLTAIALFAACDHARAGMLDDDGGLGTAITALRGAIGDHPRVLKIEIEPDGVAIEVQDPNNRSHVDRWRYGTVTLMGMIPLTRLSGPQPVDLQALVNPDLESVDLAAVPRVVKDAVARAKMQDPATVTRIEIARQLFILPNPSSGEVRWTVHVASGRE